MEKVCKNWNSAEKLWATKKRQGYNSHVITRAGKWVVIYTKPKGK
jgi:hypothetical protein